MSKVLQERGFRSLPSSTKPNLRYHVKLISTTVEADTNPIRHMRSSQYAVSTWQNSTLMYKTRQTTNPFPSRLNDYCFKEKKGKYGPKFLEANSYEALHINNSIPRKEKDPESFTLPCYINNVCFDNVLPDLGASVRNTVKYPKGIAKNVLVAIDKFVFPVDFINLDMLEDVKVPLILGRSFLSTAYAKIDVFKRKITLRVREEKIIFRSVKLASSLIKRVYILSLRERMELDLEARLIGETLVLNRSLYPSNEDYIKLNDLNEPLELRRDQVDDLIPTIEDGKLIDAPMDDLVRSKNDKLNTGIDDYPSYYDYNKKILLENMDAYRNEGMGDVIVGEPFLKEIRIKARRFEGMINIYNCNEELTYQMVRSHPRFKKNCTIKQCNKIPPLLKRIRQTDPYLDIVSLTVLVKLASFT
nr:hypothetical protein [Tanacetum cinerariifolium]